MVVGVLWIAGGSLKNECLRLNCGCMDGRVDV